MVVAYVRLQFEGTKFIIMHEQTCKLLCIMQVPYDFAIVMLKSSVWRSLSFLPTISADNI